ncbi:MAG: 50S ribosomal protein L9 [Chloroflexota bacterium]|nr:50S ribosomal protein L9 [Chloroflexota bacterium]MDQ5864765.1 50S ribosomal protein L9 [Chloroflexota bacterium]
MKVILTQNVPGVGEAGAIKEVADGYARNYLIPKKLAAPATRGSLKQAEAQAEAIARKASKQRETLQQTASALDGKVVRIRARTGSENRLYGSITPADVAEAIGKQLNVTVDRRKVELAEAIHRTGTYAATADFGSGIVAQFQVEVASEAAGAFGASAPAQSGAGAGANAAADAGGEAGAGTPEGGAGTGDAASEEVAEQEAEANPT